VKQTLALIATQMLSPFDQDPLGVQGFIYADDFAEYKATSMV